jgi:hypothetical protein
MQNELDDIIVNLFQKDSRSDYTIPDIMTALQIKSREKVVTSISRLEGRGLVEVSRLKGRAKYYRLKRPN